MTNDSTSVLRRGWPLAVLVATTLIVGGLVACSDGGGGGSPTSPVAEAVDDSGGSDGGGVTSSSGNDTGLLKISMQDAPIDDVSQLVVYITGLKVKHSEMPVERVETDTGEYDLLLLTDGVTELLVSTLVEAGTYQFIEILLDEDRSYVVEAEDVEALHQPLQIASNKVKIKGGPFEVFGDGTTSVLFDFDAEKSLKRKGNGDWQLKPFVSIVEVTEEGGDDSGGSNQ